MNSLVQTVPLQYDTGFSPYSAAEWRAAFRDIANKGFTGVEIAVAYPDLIDAKGVLAEAKYRGLAITGISTGQIFGRDGACLTSADPAKRKLAVDAVCGHIRLAERIGRPNVTVGLLRGRPETGKSEAEAMLADVMAPLASLAREAGVMLQIEPINSSEVTFITKTSEAAAFLHMMGDPASIGILFDVYHSRLEDGDIIAAALSIADRITNVHIADSHRGLPGEGETDFPAILAALMDAGYAGPFTLETLCVPDREHVLEKEGTALISTVAAAKKLMKQKAL